MNIVYVAERNHKPITLNQIHVEALPTPSMANARMEVTPIPRLPTEKVVPYISIEELGHLLILGAHYEKDEIFEAITQMIAEASKGLK